MAEYIERERLLRKFNIDDMMNVNGTLISLRDAREVISNFPAADVAPARHGRWVHEGPRFRGGVDWWHCSNCGSLASGVEMKFRYCSHCGARMDGAE